MFRIIDISRTLSPTSVLYPGDDALRFEPVATIENDNLATMALHGWSGHRGTHVDAPSHALVGGMSIEQIPLERFYVDALVHEASGDIIGAEDVGSVDVSGKAVLFKTRNSEAPDEGPVIGSPVYVSLDAARELRPGGATLVGIDYLSVDPLDSVDFPVHHELLENDVLLLEHITLRGVEPGVYRLVCFPLKIAGGDGSSVRAVLIAE